jgi:hypothetical protein
LVVIPACLNAFDFLQPLVLQHPHLFLIFLTRIAWNKIYSLTVSQIHNLEQYHQIYKKFLKNFPLDQISADVTLSPYSYKWNGSHHCYQNVKWPHEIHVPMIKLLHIIKSVCSV